MIRGLILAVVTIAFFSVGHAAELAGVSMPDAQLADGTRLQLNGIGLRTYSIFRIPIYVAGLYLEHRSDDSGTIIHSRGAKLLVINFLHNVSAGEAKIAWQDGFRQNCDPPCYLDAANVQNFLTAVPAMHKGDECILLFTSQGVDITLNGRLLAHIANRHFAEIILATFIGPVPPTPRLKRALLGFEN